MKAQAFLPMLDVLFLCVGALIASLSQMERVTSIPVEMARIGRGAAATTHGEFSVLTLSNSGMTLDGVSIVREELAESVSGKRVVLRPEGRLETEATLSVLSELILAGCEVRVQIDESAPNPSQE